jgi:hypothetical protein
LLLLVILMSKMFLVKSYHQIKRWRSFSSGENSTAYRIISRQHVCDSNGPVRDDSHKFLIAILAFAHYNLRDNRTRFCHD